MRESKKSEAPALLQQFAEEVDWLDAVPVEIPPQSAQDNNHNTPASPTRHETNYSEIPQLEMRQMKKKRENLKIYKLI